MKKILSIILFTYCSLGFSQTNFSGAISSDTTWSLSNSPYIVTGNVLVASGVTLTIEAGVTIKVSSSAVIQNNGTLIAIGTSSDKITFTSNESSPSAGDWKYIFFSNTSVDPTYDGSGNYLDGSTLQYVDILYGGSDTSKGAIDITDSSLYLKNIIVKNSASYGVHFSKSSGGSVGVSKIISSEISNNSATGVYCNCYQYNKSITVENSTINNNAGYGISTGGGDAGGTHIFNYKNNIITNNSNSGILANANGTQNIYGNIIYNNTGYGVRSRGNGTYTIEKNIIVGNNSVGVHGIYATHIIDNNVIANNAGGIEVSQGGNYTVSDNQIVFNNNSGDGSGFDPYGGNSQQAWSPDVSLTRNTFYSNTSTFSTILSFQPQNGDPSFVLNNNNIYKNISSYEFKNYRNSSTSTVDAENNYWGTATESEIQSKIFDWSDDGSYGIVDYTPFSTSLNTDAPISPPSNVTKSVSGSDIVLSWSANAESDLAGYKLHYGDPSGYSYTTTIDLGNTTSYTLPGGDIATEYAITAYDSSLDGTDDMVDGNESWFSVANEVNITLMSSATSISEPTNSATLTVTLNSTSSQDIVVNLVYTGTAINATDYAGASSITIAAGSLTGTIDVTAIDNTNIEVTKTIIIDVDTVTNASEEGVQQVSINLIDDDLPSVTLSYTPVTFNEAGGISEIIATQSEITSNDTTISLDLSGTASNLNVNEDFETALPSGAIESGSGAEVTIVADPATNGVNGDVMKIVTSTAGDVWQWVKVSFQGDNLDLTTDDKVVLVDVYSETAFTMLVKSTAPSNESAEGSTDASHGGSGWETLSFDFSNPKDGALVANDVFGGIAFFPLWNGSGFNSATVTTTYVDNISSPNGGDYRISSRIINIPAGTSSATTTITGIEDSIFDEGDETIIITPVNPTNATLTSLEATTITITNKNYAPIAAAQTDVPATEQTEVPITLVGTDSESDALTYIVSTLPTNGTLSGNGTVITIDDLPKTTTSADVVYISTSDIATSDSFTFKVNDGELNSNTATISIAITAVNDPPVLSDDSITTEEDTSVNITLNVEDLDDTEFTYVIVSDVSNGSLSITNNVATYSPQEDFNGADSFTLIANDGEANSANAIISITVNAVNDAPVALADTTTVDEGNTSTTLENGETSLLNNDTDAENNPLTAILVSDPIYGSLTLNSDGTFSYEHDGSDIASDYFTYKVNDGELDSNTAAVSIIINTVNDNFPTDIILSNNFIDENLSGVKIGQFTAEDLDLPADIHAFELVSGIGDTNNTSFTITDNNLIINESFDYETQQSLSIRVKVIDEVNQSFERSFDILINNINDISITSATIDSYCSGTSGTGSITISSIDDTLGNLTFAWSAINGGSIPSGQEAIQSLTEISDGTYSVTISDTSFSFTESFEIGLTPQYDELSICYVSSDETDETKNRIFLNNAGNYNVGIYEILRETNSANIYTSIGSMLSTENSFLDENSDNMSQSYNYKVRLIDYCGNQSPNSDFHKTILLQSSVAVNNSVNLNWSDYEGTDYGTYNIFRNTNSEGFNLIGSVSASNNSFNDAGADITIDNYEYYISISVDECLNDVSGKSNSKSSKEIKSNRLLFSTATASVDDFNDLNQLVVFPNPSNDMLNIKLSEGITLYKVKIYNTLGQMVLETQDLKFPIENLASSTYFIKIFTSKGLITRNFIKN
ncbi:Ig-like domain-containing protein [Polaribacter sp.]|nr:Ig-like domain-containing protein [Polaribacter sp.]